MREYDVMTKECKWRIAVLCAVTVLALANLPARGEETGKKEMRDGKIPGAQYVGSDTCKTCHEDIYKNFAATPHWKTTLNKKSPGQGCESCHGPGSAHVDGGGDKTKIIVFKELSAEESSRRCMTCHEYGEEHANFNRSQHNINSVGCTSCHSPHHAKEPQRLLVEAQPQLCYSCHTEAKQDFSRPFRHRVDQGLIQCTDCHNQEAASQDQVCFKCHTDKAGPFAFEHEPVKTEGCVICHTPHGSSDPRLLKRSQINLLCLECHTFTQDSDVPPPGGPVHNQSQKYQACTMCHEAIHGSNFDRVFFR